MKKNTIMASVVVVGVLGIGGWYADHRIKQAMANQVVAILNSPSAQKDIANLAQSVHIPQQVSGLIPTSKNSAPSAGTSSSRGAGAASNAMKPAPNSAQSSQNAQSAPGSASGSAAARTQSASAPVFTSRQQVVNYAMSHFTHAEIVNYLQLYMNRATLTEQQKAQIKMQILSHFTPSEIQAMEAAAAKYH